MKHISRLVSSTAQLLKRHIVRILLLIIKFIVAKLSKLGISRDINLITPSSFSITVSSTDTTLLRSKKQEIYAPYTAEKVAQAKREGRYASQKYVSFFEMVSNIGVKILNCLKILWGNPGFRTLAYMILVVFLMKVIIVVLHYFNVCASSELLYYFSGLVNKLIKSIVQEAYAGSEDSEESDIVISYNLKVMTDTYKEFDQKMNNGFDSKRAEYEKCKNTEERHVFVRNFGPLFRIFVSTEITRQMETKYEKELHKNTPFKDRLINLIILKYINAGELCYEINSFEIRCDYLNPSYYSIREFLGKYAFHAFSERHISTDNSMPFNSKLKSTIDLINSTLYTKEFGDQFCERMTVINKSVVDAIKTITIEHFKIFEDFKSEVMKVWSSNEAAVSSSKASSSSSSSSDMVSEAVVVHLMHLNHQIQQGQKRC